MFLSLVALVFFGFIAIFFTSSLIKIYNNLIDLRLQIDRSWTNIDIILEQRHEEIPKLISIIEQYTTYERDTLNRLIAARQSYSSSKNSAEKITFANQISKSLNGVLAIGESNPQLNSSSQFLQLLGRISSLEMQIADRKELVNEVITNFNVRCLQFPDIVLAKFLNYSSHPLYQPTEAAKKAPSLKIQIPS